MLRFRAVTCVRQAGKRYMGNNILDKMKFNGKRTRFAAQDLSEVLPKSIQASVTGDVVYAPKSRDLRGTHSFGVSAVDTAVKVAEAKALMEGEDSYSVWNCVVYV